jgi:electron transfer flavoprotein alpha/beta subunit
MPALVTVSSEVGEPRYPSIRRVREAAKKEIPIWNSQDVPSAKPRNKMLSLSVPVREPKCKFIAGETPEKSGYNLAFRLKEADLI